MTRQRLSTEIRQKQILEAALEVVSHKGMSGLSIGAVARQVGLVPSALYRHFGVKEQIIDALLRFIETRLLANVAAAQEEAEDPLAALESLLMLHIAMVRNNAGILRVVFSEEVYAAHSERKARVYRLLQQYLDQVAGLFRQAQQSGTVRANIGPDELAVMFLGLIQPVAILWHVSDGGFDVTRQAQRAWGVFSDAIRLQPGSRL